MIQDNLTSKQKDYAVFLPAISGFYATYIGKQRDPVNGPYVDPARMPAGIPDMEQMNWLNSAKGAVSLQVVAVLRRPCQLGSGQTGLE
jgi:hypothetical protein